MCSSGCGESGSSTRVHDRDTGTQISRFSKTVMGFSFPFLPKEMSLLFFFFLRYFYSLLLKEYFSGFQQKLAEIWKKLFSMGKYVFSDSKGNSYKPELSEGDCLEQDRWISSTFFPCEHDF